MTDFSLYERFTKQGTLSDPDEVPDPRFALPSTVNWMRALRLLVQDRGLNFGSASSFYSQVQKRAATPQQENTIFEQLLFALHQLSAIKALAGSPSKADVARVGIVAWYYGIYSAGSAMIAAQDGSLQDDHTGTANVWDQQFSTTRKVLEPFNYRISSLVETASKVEIATLRGGNNFLLTESPANAAEAFGAAVSYLSGNASWWKWRAEQNLRDTREFKALNVSDFRTKAARELRDSRLASKSICFLHQAIRYRGKANYREALYLGYGNATETLLAGYIEDLAIVLEGFMAMAGAFVAKRTGQPLWDDFVNDLETNRSFTLSPISVWS